MVSRIWKKEEIQVGLKFKKPGYKSYFIKDVQEDKEDKEEKFKYFIYDEFGKSQFQATLDEMLVILDIGRFEKIVE